MEWASIFISASAFLTALVALAVSYLQLREARTSTGGRGMYMYFRPVQRDDVSPEEAALIDESLFDLTSKNPDIQMTAILLVVEVHGPAAFYEVGPHTWGEAGMPDTPLAFKPVKKLTCESGPTSFVVIIQTDLLPTTKLGVVWLQPWQRGLETSSIRSNLNGDLEEWVFYSRFRKIFAKKGVTGRWRSKKNGPITYGPISQPWQHPSAKSKILFKRRRNAKTDY
ncbi:putative membrane protein [Corynebacterium deserti GIMN1.010]|uniref:Putative membrane protein n=2 Tax=Corynebacterium TaxID=1716 RepID=A0A0M3Q9P5_9CORY|nr:putative membrane protein [Corynebacterium deserti GIMN1.010]